jgi:hypothetical protein
MTRAARTSPVLTRTRARRLWLHAQRLDAPDPFGGGPEATQRAIEHLGYVQIDTINVIERCHHHILFTRIPDYERGHLQKAQSLDKSVFEYWTHALAYVPTGDFRYFVPEMRRHRREPKRWFDSVTRADLRKVLARIRMEGPLTIRDIDDDVLVEKSHPWASRKPSKRALQLAFYRGDLTVSERVGMLKSYELLDRHFGWPQRPRPASEREVVGYLLDRALRAQGVVSLESICYLAVRYKPAMRALIERRVRGGQLLPVRLDGLEGIAHWLEPEMLDQPEPLPDGIVRLLSPFDPLVIQRKRLLHMFGYEHRFEAYVPKAKRVLGYFALPVLAGDAIVAAIDLKTDRERRKLVIQQWTWMQPGRPRALKRSIEEELGRFERFQLAT